MVDPVAINGQLSSYYSSLYSSRAAYSAAELGMFLYQITFPTLTASAREFLDSPITLKEAQQALGALQVGNNLGVDGLSSEFYKQYGEQLLPKLHDMFNRALEEGTLPQLLW